MFAFFKKLEFNRLSYLGDAGILVGAITHDFWGVLFGLFVALPQVQPRRPAIGQPQGPAIGQAQGPAPTIKAGAKNLSPLPWEKKNSSSLPWENAFHTIMLIVGVWALLGFAFPVAQEWLARFGIFAVNIMGAAIIFSLCFVFALGVLGILFSLRNFLFLFFRAF